MPAAKRGLDLDAGHGPQRGRHTLQAREIEQGAPAVVGRPRTEKCAHARTHEPGSHRGAAQGPAIRAVPDADAQGPQGRIVSDDVALRHHRSGLGRLCSLVLGPDHDGRGSKEGA